MDVVLAGYYGFGNAGDELILASLIRRLQKEDPGVSITVLSKKPSETKRDFQVEAVDRWLPWKWREPLWQADRFILGGGGLLQESSGPWNHFYYLLLVWAAKLCGCRTEVTAIGVDPIQRPLNRFWTRWVLNHWTDKISVRDEDSRAALAAAGVSAPIAVVEDPVAELEVARADRSARRIALALSPRALGTYARQDAAGLCDRLVEGVQAPVDLLVFFPEADERWTWDVAHDCRRAVHVRVCQNPRDLLAWMPSYRLVLASRFHALVLAQSCNVPFIGLGEQAKVASFCRAHHAPYFNSAGGWERERAMEAASRLYNSTGKSVILASQTD